jgi:hypothetical protein
MSADDDVRCVSCNNEVPCEIEMCLFCCQAQIRLNHEKYPMFTATLRENIQNMMQYEITYVALIRMIVMHWYSKKRGPVDRDRVKGHLVALNIFFENSDSFRDRYRAATIYYTDKYKHLRYRLKLIDLTGRYRYSPSQVFRMEWNMLSI